MLTRIFTFILALVVWNFCYEFLGTVFPSWVVFIIGFAWVWFALSLGGKLEK